LQQAKQGKHYEIVTIVIVMNTTAVSEEAETWRILHIALVAAWQPQRILIGSCSGMLRRLTCFRKRHMACRRHVYSKYTRAKRSIPAPTDTLLAYYRAPENAGKRGNTTRAIYLRAHKRQSLRKVAKVGFPVYHLVYEGQKDKKDA
jgi:hypothetical protein